MISKDPPFIGIFPSLGRSGLGNMLFPWARALVYSHEMHVPILEPHWWRPRLGPYLRREVDKRQYQRLLNQPPPLDLLLTWIKLGVYQAIQEDDLLENGSDLSKPPKLLIVKGMRDYFAPLTPHQSYIQSHFLSRLKKHQYLVKGHYVAMHVRLGDFQAAAARPNVNTSTSMEWFLAMAHRFHDVNPDQKIRLCSDGTADQLSALLQLPWIVPSNSVGPIDDLLTLANSRCIVGSNSTFSAWAAFLGNVSVLYAPGENMYLRSWPRAAEIAPGEDLPSSVLSAQ